MAALSTMPQHEQVLHGHDPNKERYIKANRWRREITLQQAYTLRDALDLARSPEAEQAILEDWAEVTGQSVDALKEEARWTRSVRLADIRLAFSEELIADTEWQMRLGTSHIKQAAVAREQDTGRALTSQEKADLLLECYHANWSVAEFKMELRRRQLKAPARAKMAAPSKTPTTATGLLIAMGEDLRSQGIDIDLAGLMKRRGAKPINVVSFLQFLAGEFKRERPDAEFKVEE